jgi:ribosomal protein S6--L-glutamate ligase
VIPRIGASVSFYGTSVVRQFETMRVFSTVDSQALVRSRDKLRSLQILSRAGVDMPRTVFTNYSKDVASALEHVGGAPCIIKLLEGTQGLGVVLAETRKAAIAVVEAFNSLKARVIVQEFIKEARGVDVRAFVVDGTIVGAMKRTGRDGEFRSNLHRGGKAELTDLSPDEARMALHAARALGLQVAGVDLLRSDRGPLVIEVNASPGLEGIEHATGKDIAGEIVAYRGTWPSHRSARLSPKARGHSACRSEECITQASGRRRANGPYQAVFQPRRTPYCEYLCRPTPIRLCSTRSSFSITARSTPNCWPAAYANWTCTARSIPSTRPSTSPRMPPYAV